MKNQSTKETRFAQIIEQYDDVIRRTCFIYSSENALFDDLYQETMLNIWRGLDTFRGDSSVATWIYRITVNSCLSWLRYNKRHTGHRSLDETLTLIAGDDSEARDQLLTMYEMISQLNPMQKAIITMWLDGYDYAEIADVVGLSRENVAVRLHRIKSILKNNSKQ